MVNVLKTLLLLPLFCISTVGYAQYFNEWHKIVASDRGPYDHFGRVVAISGNYVIVGVYEEDEDAFGGNTLEHSGSVYVFELNQWENWPEVQKIVASDRARIDGFGWSVAISGNYALIGAYGEDEDALGGDSLSKAGSAYLFERDGSGNWIEVQKIVASDRAADDQFGHSVAISGNYAIVGTYLESEDASGGNTMEDAGSAYIFKRDSSGNWIEVQKITASDRAINDKFAFSLSISGDHIIVGAMYENEDALGGNTISSAGSAYVFEQDGNGSWIEVQKIVASDRAAYDDFGHSVSISGDYALVGTRYNAEDADGLNTMSGAGSAYVFERDSSGNWVEVQKIVASDRAVNDYFGRSLSINGNYAIVGAINEDEDADGLNFLASAGSVYLFERDSSGSWLEIQKIVASDREFNDVFGYSVAIGKKYAVVGAWDEAEDPFGGNFLDRAGSAYMFEPVVPTGIAENNFYSQILIYPNPSTGEFIVRFNSEVRETINIKVFNILGQNIFSEIINQDQGILEKQIDLKDYPAGVYIFQLITERGVINRQLIIE